MRNLKRALSMALASVMVLGLTVVGAGAAGYQDFTDASEIEHTEAVSMITELGILAGLPDGSFGPTQNIDRASFARLVCVVMNGGKEPVLGNLSTNFTDTQGNWAEKYIAFCVNRGIIAGRGDGSFGPSDNVTGSEAAKMLLVALGYNAEYEGIGGATWQTTTDVLANTARLYSGLETINTSEPLTRDQAAQMIYNVLNAETVSYTWTYNASGSTVAVQNKSGETMLEDVFGAIRVEGVVVANEYANLNSSAEHGAALDAGKTRIDVTNYGSNNDQNVFNDGTYSVSTGADVLGRSIILYVKDDSSNASKATVLGNAILGENNVVVTKTNNHLLSKIASDNDLSLADDTTVIVNYANGGDYGDYADDQKVRGVEKTLVDNNDDGTVDYAFVTTYSFGKVTRYSTRDDGSITIDIGASNLSANDSADVVGFDDVEKDDYVLTAWIGGKLYVEPAESVTGTLEAYKSGETLTVDGTKYDISQVKGFTDGTDMQAAADFDAKNALDNEAVFYLDKNGMIVAVGEAEENAYNYAYVWAHEDGGVFDDDRVKVTLADGTTSIYDVDAVKTADNKDASAITDKAIYTYSINSDNEIKLTEVKNSTETALDFTKGQSRVNATVQSTLNTVFFYVSLKDDDTTVKDVDVYTGYRNAPTLDDDYEGNGVLVLDGGKKAAAVAFVGATTTSKDVSNHLYITDIGSETSDYTEVSAIFDGTDEVVDIKVDTDDLNGKGVYLYSEGTDDVYTLDSADDNYVTAGFSDTDDDGMYIGDDYYKLTEDTVLVEVSGEKNDSFESAVLGSLPASDSTIVGALVNDDELLMIIANIDTEDEGGSTVVPSEQSEVTKGNTSDIYAVADAFSADGAARTALREGMSDVTVSTSGNTVAISGTIGYTEGLTGFSSVEADQNGYYAVLQVRVPSALDKVTHYQTFKADWGDDGEWSANAELDGANYFILVLKCEQGVTPSNVQVQWTNAEGNVIGTSTVRFDVSGLSFE